MQAAYRGILERRRWQILDQVPWTRDLAAALERAALLTNDELRDIETDFNPKNRMFIALSKLMGHDEPGVFERFRQILQNNGHDTMADSLDFDRSRIHWDFEKQPLVTSMSDYIDHLTADLLQASTSEPDDYIRQCMVLEAKRRVDLVRNTVRQQQLDREKFRGKMTCIITGKQPSSSCYKYKQGDFMTLSEIEDSECARDEMILKEASALIVGLRRKVAELSEEVDQLKRSVEDRCDVEDSNLSMTNGILISEESMDDNDIEINDQHNESQTALNISASMLDRLMKSLNVITATTSNDAVNVKDITADKLTEMLEEAGVELERWRSRSRRLSLEIEQMEKDREAIAKELGLSEAVASDRQCFSQCIIFKLNERKSGDPMRRASVAGTENSRISDSSRHPVRNNQNIHKSDSVASEPLSENSQKILVANRSEPILTSLHRSSSVPQKMELVKKSAATRTGQISSSKSTGTTDVKLAAIRKNLTAKSSVQSTHQNVRLSIHAT